MEFKTKPDEVFEKTRIEISDLPAPNRFVLYLKIIANS